MKSNWWKWEKCRIHEHFVCKKWWNRGNITFQLQNFRRKSIVYTTFCYNFIHFKLIFVFTHFYPFWCAKCLIFTITSNKFWKPTLKIADGCIPSAKRLNNFSVSLSAHLFAFHRFILLLTWKICVAASSWTASVICI